MTNTPSVRYPILVACIGQDRAPRPGEIERVAHRVLREGFGERTGAARQRLAFRIARTALLGVPAAR